MNVQYESEVVIPQTDVDVSVAVATPSGLITPIVHNADMLGLSDISQRVRVSVSHGNLEENWSSHAGPLQSRKGEQVATARISRWHIYVSPLKSNLCI